MKLEDVLQKWPVLKGRSALEWVRFSDILMHQGQEEASETLLLAAGSRPDACRQARGIAHRRISYNVPKFHERILGDPVRNRIYQEALNRTLRPGDHVLDIGTGSGLLAMMAAGRGPATGRQHGPDFGVLYAAGYLSLAGRG